MVVVFVRANDIARLIPHRAIITASIFFYRPELRTFSLERPELLYVYKASYSRSCSLRSSSNWSLIFRQSMFGFSKFNSIDTVISRQSEYSTEQQSSRNNNH